MKRITCLLLCSSLLTACSAKMISESGKGMQTGAVVSGNGGVLTAPIFITGFIMDKVGSAISEPDNRTLTDIEKQERHVNVRSLLARESLVKKFREALINTDTSPEQIKKQATEFCNNINERANSGQVITIIDAKDFKRLTGKVATQNDIDYVSNINPFGSGCTDRMTTEGEEVISSFKGS